MLRDVMPMLVMGALLGGVSGLGCSKPEPNGQAEPAPDRITPAVPAEADLYGAVKAVDAIRRTITLSAERKDGEEKERAYDVGKDATVLLDSPGQLADLSAGSRVALVFDTERKAVIEVRTEPFRILVKPKTKQVEVNRPFDVELRVINVSVSPQSFRAMSCSWYEHWKSSNLRVSWIGWGCKGNVPMPVKLAPGKAYEKVLPMRATTTGLMSFRMGFTPLQFDTGDGPRKQPAKRTYWSSEVTIRANQG